LVTGVRVRRAWVGVTLGVKLGVGEAAGVELLVALGEAVAVGEGLVVKVTEGVTVTSRVGVGGRVAVKAGALLLPPGKVAWNAAGTDGAGSHAARRPVITSKPTMPQRFIPMHDP
jgi:hypothetical protein